MPPVHAGCNASLPLCRAERRAIIGGAGGFHPAGAKGNPMRIDETYVAQMDGGVFYDPLSSIDTRAQWVELSERIRPGIRATLADVGMYEPIDITIGDNGFIYSYKVDLVKHEISVAQKQLGFSYNRFKLRDGVPRDVAAVTEKMLELIGRQDWTEIGAIIGFALPLKAAQQTTINVDLLRQTLLHPGESVTASVFHDGQTQVVDLSINGTLGPWRVSWNAYNQRDDQHLVVTLDVKAYRHQMDASTIRVFHETVLTLFKERCGPFVESLLAAPQLVGYLDTDFLVTGRR